MTELVRSLYTLALAAGRPLMATRLWWRGRRQPEYRLHWQERFQGTPAEPPPGQPLIWVHAVSVGETQAAEPLIAALRTQFPGHAMLLTHMTPTGRASGVARWGDDVLHAYLPYDFPWALRAFLDHYRPRIAIIMETEVWPNLLAALDARGIPAALVNGRLSARSARGYQRLAWLVQAAFARFAWVGAQSEADAHRLRAMGARSVEVTGNLKFDVDPDPALIERGLGWRQDLGCDKKVLLAASTREGEEALLLDAWKALPAPARLGILLVIAPRHPQRFDAVAALMASSGLAWARRSQVLARPGCEVWLGDSMGEMAAYYAMSDVALIGGSLADLGSHNFIEASAQGRPVLLGPSIYNFEDAARAAVAAGAAFQAADLSALFAEALRLLANAEAYAARSMAGRAFAREHRGATARTLARLMPMLRTNERAGD